MEAVEKGKIEVCRLMFDHRADPNLADKVTVVRPTYPELGGSSTLLAFVYRAMD